MKLLNNIGTADLKLLKELYPNNFNEIEQKLKEKEKSNESYGK